MFIETANIELETVVLETIELGNYNREYGDNKQTKRKQKRISSDSSSNGEQAAHTKPTHTEHSKPTRRKYRTETVTFVVHQTGQWTTYARHERHSATTARKKDTLQKYENLKPSTGYGKKMYWTAKPSHGQKQTEFNGQRY